MTDPYLEFVLVVGVGGGEVSELLRQSETVFHMFWRHKVLRYLDAAVQVMNLEERGG